MYIAVAESGEQVRGKKKGIKKLRKFLNVAKKSVTRRENRDLAKKTADQEKMIMLQYQNFNLQPQPIPKIPVTIQEARDVENFQQWGCLDTLSNSGLERQQAAPAGVAKSATARHPDEPYVNYDVSKTVLFQLMLDGHWKEVCNRCASHPDEVGTWIVRFGSTDKTKIRWEHLPLHTAIILNCPAYVLPTMVSTYPMAVTRTDNQGMLPLHRTFRLKVKNDEVAGFLFKYYVDTYPAGFQVKDSFNKMPIEYYQQGGFLCTLTDLHAQACAKSGTVTENDGERNVEGERDTDLCNTFCGGVFF